MLKLAHKQFDSIFNYHLKFAYWLIWFLNSQQQIYLNILPFHHFLFFLASVSLPRSWFNQFYLSAINLFPEFITSDFEYPVKANLWQPLTMIPFHFENNQLSMLSISINYKVLPALLCVHAHVKFVFQLILFWSQLLI